MGKKSSTRRSTLWWRRFRTCNRDAVARKVVSDKVLEDCVRPFWQPSLKLAESINQQASHNGTLKTSGLGSNSAAKEAIKVGFDYFKANAHRVSASIKPGDHDYHLHVVELHNTGPTNAMTLASFVALCSAVFGKPLQQQMVVLGSMSLGGNIIPVENLAESLQVAFDAGAKRILLPMASVKDIPTIPGELFAKFQTGFYADPVDAVFKALGVQ